MYIFSLPDEQYVEIDVLFDNNRTKYNDYVNISNTMSIKPVCRLVSFSLDSNALYMAHHL